MTLESVVTYKSIRLEYKKSYHKSAVYVGSVTIKIHYYGLDLFSESLSSFSLF